MLLGYGVKLHLSLVKQIQVRSNTHTHTQVQEGCKAARALCINYLWHMLPCCYVTICSSIKSGTNISPRQPFLAKPLPIHRRMSAAAVFNLRPNLNTGKSYTATHSATNVHTACCIRINGTLSLPLRLSLPLSLTLAHKTHSLACYMHQISTPLFVLGHRFMLAVAVADVDIVTVIILL